MTRQALPRLIFVTILVVSGWLAVSSVRAQTTSASLVGVVRTEAGEPQANAVVQARSEETGAVRTAVSDERGEYRLDMLSPGAWVVVASLAGGEISESRTVQLRLQQALRLDFTVGTGLSEKVTITAEAPLIDRKETAGSLLLSGDQIETLPVAGRDFTSLALLDSSVRQAAPGNFYGERGSVFVVNGQTGRSNTFLVDGLDNNDQTSGTTLNSFFSQQTIREFVLSTHQYSPEFGRASGGVLNVVTHQGTNEARWSAFAQGTAGGLSSSGEFVDSLPDTGTGATQQSFQTGVTFGGPFKKDKAFYFLAYEHQSADNVIPYIGIDRDGVEGGRVASPNENDSFFVRTDFNLTPRNQLMFRLSANDRKSTGINVGGIVTPEAGFRIDERDFQLAASLTSILGPKLIGETRFLVSDSDFEQFANSDRPGVTRPSGIFGGNTLNQQLRGERKFQFVQNFTLQRRSHTMKFGVDVIRSRTSIDTGFNPNGTFTYTSDRAFEPGDCGFGASLPVNHLPDGTVIDTNGNIVCQGQIGVDDDQDGDFDEGANIFTYPDVYTLVDGHPSATLDDTGVGIFAQDTWEIGPRWLLDYGLRYDLNTFTLPDSARVDSTIPNGGAGRDTDNIAPRLGFTFTPRADGRTVVRGGGGIFYDKLVLGFPAVTSITSGTNVGFMPLQGLALEITEETVERDGPLPGLAFPPDLIMRFSTATELETPYTVQFNLGLEQAIGRHGAAKVNVIRSQGYHVPLMKDLNPVVGLVEPGFLCADGVDPSREEGYPCHADSTRGSISAITTEGRSWYWGLDLGYRAQVEGAWFSVTYTLSRAEDLGFDPLKGGIALPPDSTDLRLERSRSDGDRRHRMVLSADSPLPWMGLRLSGVMQLATGLPFNVTTGQDENSDGILTDRPEGLRRNSGEQTPLDLVNQLRREHNVTLPEDEQLAPIGSLNEPRFAQVDLRLYRPFKIGKKGAGDFFFQVFNVLDRQNAALIEGRAISRNFGEVITLAGPPRTVELGLRVSY